MKLWAPMLCIRQKATPGKALWLVDLGPHGVRDPGMLLVGVVHENIEIFIFPWLMEGRGRRGKRERNPRVHDMKKSDTPIVPIKGRTNTAWGCAEST
jgi:hypothetical protein